MKNLFIAGNGFDTQHCVQFKTESGKLIKNGYRDFAEFFEEENKEIFDLFDKELFSSDEQLVSSKIKKDKYQGWDNLEQENLYEALEIGSYLDLHDPNNPMVIFYETFKKWLKNLNSNISIDNFIYDEDKKKEFEDLKKLVSNKEMYFINFNYTDTLRKIYDVEKSKICHIHGNPTNPIIAYNKESPAENFKDPKSSYWLVPTCRKPVDQLKKELCNWVKSQVGPDTKLDIYVYGFNFNDKDGTYLAELLNEFKACSIRVSNYQARKIESEGDRSAFVQNIFSNVRPKVTWQKNKSIKITNFNGEKLIEI